MAGAFGFEKDKFDISQAIGERMLLPAIRRQSSETLIVADGFSCREQIRQGTGRDALHLSEVLSLAVKQRNAAKKSEEH
jgi:Fe-S oxidoreductase